MKCSEFCGSRSAHHRHTSERRAVQFVSSRSCCIGVGDCTAFPARHGQHVDRALQSPSKRKGFSVCYGIVWLPDFSRRRGLNVGTERLDQSNPTSQSMCGAFFQRYEMNDLVNSEIGNCCAKFLAKTSESWCVVYEIGKKNSRGSSAQPIDVALKLRDYVRCVQRSSIFSLCTPTTRFGSGRVQGDYYRSSGGNGRSPRCGHVTCKKSPDSRRNDDSHRCDHHHGGSQERPFLPSQGWFLLQFALHSVPLRWGRSYLNRVGVYIFACALRRRHEP